jgi:hypothetical protein
MGKVILIETSDFTVRCEPLSSGIRESTDKTGMMILKGHTEKSRNATVGRTKILISRDLESAARNFSVSPKGVPATNSRQRECEWASVHKEGNAESDS